MIEVSKHQGCYSSFLEENYKGKVHDINGGVNKITGQALCPMLPSTTKKKKKKKKKKKRFW
jgi:hypothetical protein